MPHNLSEAKIPFFLPHTGWILDNLMNFVFSEAKTAVFFPFTYTISESLPQFFFFLLSSGIG